jgi:glycosyltransferase involved in cell wall biosynthesis
MRVAHILRKYVPAEWGGTETAIRSLTSGLATHGVTSLVYHPVVAGQPESDPLAEGGCEMHPFHAHLPIIGLSPAERREMVAVGGNLLSFDLPWMLGREPDLAVIHSHVLGRLGGIAGTVARRRNLPFVVTLHGGVFAMPDAVKEKLRKQSHLASFEWGQLFGWWWRARHVLAEADALVTCNAREAELLRERYPNQQVVVQPHGVNTRFYRTDQRQAARAAFPALAGQDILLYVARIDPVKNQRWLVEQMPAVLARHPRAVLVLAGACTNPDYAVELHQEIRRLGLGGKVVLTGGLPPGDPRLAGLMQLARVAFLSSVSEAFGLVILEAWAAGLPILASRTPGAAGLVRDGENGCLFDLDQPAGFHAWLDRLLLDAPFRERLIAAGHAGADQYDTAAIAGRMQQLYARLSGEKHALRNSA